MRLSKVQEVLLTFDDLTSAYRRTTCAILSCDSQEGEVLVVHWLMKWYAVSCKDHLSCFTECGWKVYETQ